MSHGIDQGLADALSIARDRLADADDSGAYADDDIIRSLVEAVEPLAARPTTLSAELMGIARDAAGKARQMTEEVQATAANAPLGWARMAKETLEAYRLAVEVEHHGPDADREAASRLAQHYREQVQDHRRFLATLADEFDSAGTPTAARVAVRIRGHLVDEPR